MSASGVSPTNAASPASTPKLGQGCFEDCLAGFPAQDIVGPDPVVDPTVEASGDEGLLDVTAGRETGVGDDGQLEPALLESVEFGFHAINDVRWFPTCALADSDDDFVEQVITLDRVRALLEHRAADGIDSVVAGEIDVRLVGDNQLVNGVTNSLRHRISCAAAGSSLLVGLRETTLALAHPAATATGRVNDQRAPEIQGDGAKYLWRGQWMRIGVVALAG